LSAAQSAKLPLAMAPSLTTVEPRTARAAGYACREYADSLAEFGELVELPASGGWLLAREVPRSECFDAMGPYPLFACQNWAALGDDLEALADRFVCASLVTDPFAAASPELLHAAFPDVCFSYKQHFVTDLSRPLDAVTPSHHRRNVRKALRSVDVQQSSADGEALTEWLGLYDQLIERHAITGIARFSPRAFERQMCVPGFTAFAAFAGDACCGMTLWYVAGDVAYYHLAAYSDCGYELGASFALFATALAHFAKAGLRWAALGAGAGATAADSGLTRFKQGWATGTRPVYFCGRILQPERYRDLTARIPPGSNYFPAYRSP
jgi:hypothetical protein